MALPIASDYFVTEFIPYIINQVTNRMNQRFKKALKEFGVSISQWRVLACLTTASDLSLTEIGIYTAIDQPTLSRIVDQLVERELVVREPRASDGRFQSITLAPAGVELLKRAWPMAWRHSRLLVAALDQNEEEELRRLALKVLRSME